MVVFLIIGFINIMYYNIGFALGDPSNDGHGMVSEFHIEASHSIKSIEMAYKRATEKLGWNYLETVCSEYDDCTIDSEQIYDIDKKLGLDIKSILASWCIRDLEEKGSCYLGEDDFLEIFFEIITSEIPDFEWRYRELKEDTLDILDGAGYGLFSH